MVSRTSLFFLLFFGASLLVKAQKSADFALKNLAITWQLIDNNFEQSDRTKAVFTFINKDKTPFPATGWTIYFNSSREMDHPDAGGGARIKHINGDIYTIEPTAQFKPILPGDSTQIVYFSNGPLINYTATPCGLYLVWDKAPEKGYPVSNWTILPLKNTTPGQVTAEKVFQQNSLIRDIPFSELPKIFPSPIQYKETEGVFILKPETVIQADPGFEKEAALLRAELQRLFGQKSNTNPKPSGGRIRLQSSNQADREAYSLSVSKEEMVISASSGAGIFYGIQSLRSLMPLDSWKGVQEQVLIPAVEVQDAPRFGYRSFMLDVARNFKPQKDIFRVLDLMALYKMNVFHFHFSDDEGWRVEIPGLPELTELGAKRGHTQDSKTCLPASYGAGPEPSKTLGSGFYSRAEFIEILKYAGERHIQVIPEIESPGHSRAAIKAMDLRFDRWIKKGNRAEAEKYLLSDPDDRSTYRSAQNWTDNVLCVAQPSVYTFLEKVVDELALMYREAGVPLSTIHLGGDEVPAGVWEKSPICQKLIESDPEIETTDDLWYYYFGRVHKILDSKGLFLSAWEEAGMRKTKLDGNNTLIVNPRFANKGFQLHVWNNVTGWGAEDLPYRLANAGYKVVLSPVSNNYLDLAYCKHPDEPGYYWGGFQDIDKPFYFIPFDYYRTSVEDPSGNPVDPHVFDCKERLTDFGKSNIVGIQGLLWAENLRSVEDMEYLLLPKLLGVAERAWAKEPEWAMETDKPRFEKMYGAAWSQFVNVVGKRELPRLDYFADGFKYRIPWAGARVENGSVMANVQFPGLSIRYTTDGSEPTIQSRLYQKPIQEKGRIKLKVFDGRDRGSLTTTLDNK